MSFEFCVLMFFSFVLHRRRNDFLQLMLDAEANEESLQENGDCEKQARDKEKSSRKSKKLPLIRLTN